MDMVDYSEATYETIVNDYKALAYKVGLNKVKYIPVSALKGDNIVYKSDIIIISFLLLLTFLLKISCH